MLEDCADRYQTTDWAFYDDALLIQKEKHLIPFLESIDSERISPFRFHVPNALHSAPIDRKVADMMKAAGFETLRLGLEFSREDRMKETGGKVKWTEYQNAVRCLLDAGFSPGPNWELTCHDWISGTDYRGNERMLSKGPRTR